MTRSGGRLIAIAVPMVVLAIVLAYQTDNAKGRVAEALIAATILIGISGMALLLYGLGKLAVGLIKRE